MSTKVKVGSVLTAGKGATVVDYDGATHSLSIVEDMEEGLVLRVSVRTNEDNPTANRPNYQLDIDVPVDHRVARFLGTALDRFEEVGPEYQEPHLHFEMKGIDLEDAIRRFHDSGSVIRPSDTVPLDDVLLTLDDQAISAEEREEFRTVVNGGPYILKSEEEAFRRFRAQREEQAGYDDPQAIHDLVNEPDTKAEDRDLPPGAETLEHRQPSCEELEGK